jgi:hypothetical protein
VAHLPFERARQLQFNFSALLSLSVMAWHSRPDVFDLHRFFEGIRKTGFIIFNVGYVVS